MGIFRCIIHPCEQHVFKCDLAMCGSYIVLASGKKFLEWILAVHWHGLTAQFIGRSVQGDSQVDLQWFLAKFTNSWHQPHGRYSHMSCAQVKAFRAIEDA